MYDFGLGLRGILHNVRLRSAARSLRRLLLTSRGAAGTGRWTGNKRKTERHLSLPPAWRPLETVV